MYGVSIRKRRWKMSQNPKLRSKNWENRLTVKRQLNFMASSNFFCIIRTTITIMNKVIQHGIVINNRYKAVP